MAVKVAGDGSHGYVSTLWTVMLGFCFSNEAMSSAHSLDWTGSEGGGAQSMLIVTGPLLAAVVLVAAGVPLLEHAATAARPRAAVRVTPATFR
jgi:hypothetical protein